MTAAHPPPPTSEPAATGVALFSTAIGCCGVAWNEAGIVAVQLPESRESATRTRLFRRLPGAVESRPPEPVASAIQRMRALLAGELVDLSDVVLDMSTVPAFPRRVYEVTRTIPPGETSTYGDVALRAQVPGGARAVGRALGQNPYPIIVPCHRVVAAQGLGGFSARGGAATKHRMLTIEGALAPTLFDADR